MLLVLELDSPRQTQRAKQRTYNTIIYSNYICGADGTRITKFARLDPPQRECEMCIKIK